MKPTFLAAVVMLSASSALWSAPDAEVLSIDGSQLKGHVTDITGGALVLDSPSFFSPAPLQLDQILEVSLPPRQGQLAADHVASITLSNGDLLRGQLVSVNDQTIGLKTWYAGDMNFRRSMVDKLEIQDLPGRIYFGPSGESDWLQTGSKNWEVAASQLISHGNGGISRMLKLPAKTRFSFDLAWRQNPRFHFYFYADAVGKEKPKNYFDLSCQSRYVYLRKTKEKQINNNLGNADVREFSQNKQAHIDLFVNRDTGMIRLMVNGRVVWDWTDSDPGLGGLGGGIHFVNDDASAMRVSRIEVTEWDGALDAVGPANDPDEEGDPPSAEATAEAPAPPTRVRLKNNDEIDGETTGIEDGVVKLKTTFGDVEIPVARLRTFSLHTPDQRKDTKLYEIPRLYSDDICGWFADGSHVTFRLKDIKDGHIEGVSQPFGNATFDLSSFQRLEFNLYREGLDSLRSQDRW